MRIEIVFNGNGEKLLLLSLGKINVFIFIVIFWLGGEKRIVRNEK